MTKEQFNIFWSSNFPRTIPVQHYFRKDYPDKWLRIHSLPGSKRYAETEYEWNVLLDRQNQVMTDLLGYNSTFILVTYSYALEGFKEVPFEEVNSIGQIPFISLDPIDLGKLDPEHFGAGTFWTPMFAEQIWQAAKFDNILKDIAIDALRAFFISVDKRLIVAPYDGGIDLILKDTELRNIYKQKYNEWLSPRHDGL